MNREDLYRAIGQADETLLERTEKNKCRYKKPWWMGAVAAVLVLAVVSGLLLRHGENFLITTAYAINEASYPEMAHYPNEMSLNFDQQYDAWRDSIEAQQQPAGYADGLEPFFENSIRQFLSGEEGENKAYSPLNVYMALGILAELTGGSSRQQILDVIGVDSMETLRHQASAVWNGQYRNDGATTSILASSLWLDENISFVPETMEQLADTYYASSYQGEMGSDAFNKALQNWLNQQTGGLLNDQVQGIALDADAVLSLATTIYYQAKWGSTFSEERTTPEVFHALSGNLICDFMHSDSMDTYYWADRFSAIAKPLENGGGTMWFLLPDEGVSVQDLLQDDETMEFLLSKGEWENSKYLEIHLSLPKFDISSQLDLCEGLQALGVTDVFDPKKSDFSSMTTDTHGVFLSQAEHGVRVAIDEEGVTAAAYTVMTMNGAGEPPKDEIDFTLDRPFLFAVTSNDGLPLFVGSVYQPVL